MLRILIPSLLLIYFAFAAYQEGGASLNGRIVGGENVDILDYPYQVSVEYLGNHRCGGAIIARTWVITAAHCVHGLLYPTRFNVRVGSSYRGVSGELVNVSSIIFHQNFSTSDNDYDIALLLLSPPITLTPRAKIIQLPINGESVEAGTVVDVTGWGYTSEGGETSLVLNAINISVWSQEVCNSTYASYLVSERMLCAGVSDGSRDACTGDGGGPLVGNNSVLYGLVSWGIGCARPQRPGVYANVSAFRDWITNHTGI